MEEIRDIGAIEHDFKLPFLCFNTFHNLFMLMPQYGAKVTGY